MSLVHDIIKMKYIREGYLPNHPYHLISDEEMCDAFLNNHSGYFFDNYPLVVPSLRNEYNALVDAITENIEQLKTSTYAEYTLPDWVYSYMLGDVISVNSSKLDIHDTLVMMNRDNLNDIFTPQASLECYRISEQWVKKTSCASQKRPPTMFGEPHVIKSLRLQQLNGG